MNHIERYFKTKSNHKFSNILELDPWSFDQLKFGWRYISELKDQEIAIMSYLNKYSYNNTWKSNTPKSTFNPIILPSLLWFHLGQVQLFMSKDALTALNIAYKLELNIQFKKYILATVAFVEKDHNKFELAIKNLTENKRVINTLKNNFDKDYKDIY